MANGYIIQGSGQSANLDPRSLKLERPIPPIRYNGATYVVAYSSPLARPGRYLAVYKTIDATAPFTFSEMDLANEIETIYGAAFYPQTGGNLIYLALTVSGVSPSKVNILTFDMNTGTFSAVISSAGPTAFTSDGGFSIAHRANGNWLLGFNAVGGSQIEDVWWSEYNGATWSASAKVSTLAVASNDFATIESMAINDATGDAAFYWDQQYHSEGYATHHRYLTVISNARGSWYKHQLEQQQHYGHLR